MAETTGYVLAAAGIAIGNQLIFEPVAEHKSPQWNNLNWRVIPATAVAALMLGGIEQVSPPLAKGLAILAIMAVLTMPTGNARSPVENLASFIGV